MKSKKIYGVIGLGRFGMPLAQRLALAGEEVIGVDMNEDKVEEFREFSDLAFVTKSARFLANVLYPPLVLS